MRKTLIAITMMLIAEGLFAQIQATERVPGIADVKLKMDKATAFSILQAKGWTIELVTLNLKTENFERYAANGFMLGNKPFAYLMDFYKGLLVRIYVVYISDNMFPIEIENMFREFYGGLRQRLISLYGNPEIETMNLKPPYTEKSYFVDSFIADCCRPMAIWKPAGYTLVLEMKPLGLVFTLGIEYMVNDYLDIIKDVTKGSFDTL